MNNYSINVTIWGDAGMVDLLNHENKTKLTLHDFQPYGAALHQGRKIAEILTIPLTINNLPDDGRTAESVVCHEITPFGGD